MTPRDPNPQIPILRRQLEECEKAAGLLEQAATQIREKPVSAALAFRGAALLAAAAAQELLLTAGMLELVESAEVRL